MREAVLAGVKADDVRIDYRFFVGRAKDGVEGLNTKLRLVKENHLYNDVVVLDQFRDVPERLSEKRFEAIKWVRIFFLSFEICVLVIILTTKKDQLYTPRSIRLLNDHRLGLLLPLLRPRPATATHAPGSHTSRATHHGGPHGQASSVLPEHDC